MKRIMHPPEDVQRAVGNLSIIWSKHRLEKISINGGDLQYKAFSKNFHVWDVHSQYQDVRDHSKIKNIVFVFVTPRTTLGSDLAQHIVETYSESVDHLVAIRGKESKAAATTFDAYEWTWETISYDEIRVNKLEYSLVPTYRIMVTEEQKKSAMNDLGITSQDLPLVPLMHFRHDPMARLLGFREGDLVQVRSPDALTGENTSYRYVTVLR